jgi:YegS/Rv2252/BmrU family lipid kinase
MPSRCRALLLVNRHARRGEQNHTQLVQQLQALDFEVVEAAIEDPQLISEMIYQHRNDVDLVVIGGGDGTLNAAAAGLMETQLPLGIVPLGTANDLAHTLGIPASIPEACQIIAAGHQCAVDLGWVNGKYFFNVASIGLSVQITKRLTRGLKQRWGILAYLLTGLRVLWQARPFTAEIHANRQIIPVKTLQITIGNGRFYGGGLAIAEDAAINDRWLDLYSLEVKHWWQIVLLLPAISRGQLAKWPGTRTLRAEEIEVVTPYPAAINTDGEITATTPARFQVVPKAISIFVPMSKAPGLK